MRATEGSPARLQDALGSKYQVLRWIGGGGMAQVYLARNRTTGGLFAVKLLAEHLSGEENIVARFLQEARTSAALSGHPNIVSIFDVGQFENLHYIIMQYVEGEDLKTHLKRRGKLPPAEAARVVEQIAGALVFAHSRTVVHRDLKPSNVKIQNTGRAVVLDFGIAKAGDMPSQLTTAGQRVGTPYYMSPEHFLTGACDARSDLYALGVVFFELLTGRRPFEGESVADIEAAHRERPAPSPRESDSSIPEAFARITLRLLEKRPEDRYQRAADLVADIRQALAGTPAEAAPAEPPPAAAPPAEPAVPAAIPYKADAPARRGRRPVAVLAAVAVVIAGAAAGFYYRAASHPVSPSSSASSLAPFAMDAAPVANTDYKAFCDQTGHPYPEPPPGDPNYFYARPDGPVLNVAHRDAEAFAKWAGKRLPSAGEWDQSPQRGAAAEWTSTPFTPSEADVAAFRKLAGGDPRGGWYVLKGGAPLGGWPSDSPPRGFTAGFRCVKDGPR